MSDLQPDDSTHRIEVDRYQLFRVLNGNEEAPHEWRRPEREPSSMGDFVTAYSSDLSSPELIGQHVTIGGIVRCTGGPPPTVLIHDGGGAVELVMRSLPSWMGGGQVVLVRGVVMMPLTRNPAYDVNPRLLPEGFAAWERAAVAGPVDFAKWVVGRGLLT